LLKSPDFTGCVDDYLDAVGSSLIMYCVGPANAESLPMVKKLMLHGGSVTHKNQKGETALSYVKAWKNKRPKDVNYYDPLINFLILNGCDPNEPRAF